MIGLVTSSLLARMLSTPEFGAYPLVLSVFSLRPLVGSLRLPKLASLLKNSFTLSSAPGSWAKYAVYVVFWPCFRALLESRPGRQPLFQQAVAF